MKRKHKHYLVLTIIFTFILFSLGIAVRYIIDPVGLNNKFHTGLFKDTALAYRTQKFIELNEFKPNTIILGGSRVHYMNPQDVKKYTKDRVYNLGFPFGTLEEQYYFLKYSLEHFEIKNVIIGLNLYPFSEKLPNNNSDFDKELFEDGFTFTKQIKHYLEVPLFKYLRYVLTTDLKEPFYKDGAITAYQEQMTLSEPKKPRWEASLSGYKTKYRDYLVWGDTNLNYFKKIVELCKEHNVNLKVFTTAIHTSQLKILEEVNKMDIYYKWKDEIAKITPYWDFMYENSISNDEEKYIDSSHIKQEYLYLYLARIFNDTNTSVPEDFGRFVPKK